MKLTDVIKKEYAEIQPIVQEKIDRVRKDYRKEIRQILIAYEKILENYSFEKKLSLDHNTSIYDLIIRNETKIQYSADTITAVCNELLQFEKNDYFESTVGIFLSELITQHFYKNPKQESYILITENYKQNNLNLLCSNLSVNAVIVMGNTGFSFGQNLSKGFLLLMGDAGNFVGSDMQGGKIQIEGSAKSQVGRSMINGEIIINGNVDSGCGYQMKNGSILCKSNAGNSVGNWMGNGTIIIEGNTTDKTGLSMWNGTIHILGKAGKDIGQQMKNGKIFLHDDYESIGTHQKGGEIYHKERRVFP